MSDTAEHTCINQDTFASNGNEPNRAHSIHPDHEEIEIAPVVFNADNNSTPQGETIESLMIISYILNKIQQILQYNFQKKAIMIRIKQSFQRQNSEETIFKEVCFTSEDMSHASHLTEFR